MNRIGIELRNVQKCFGAQPVLRDIDLAIEPGEFCVFVGPSGCGKSTLLRLIAGLDEPSEGTISIGGHRVDHLPPPNATWRWCSRAMRSTRT